MLLKIASKPTRRSPLTTFSKPHSRCKSPVPRHVHLRCCRSAEQVQPAGVPQKGVSCALPARRHSQQTLGREPAGFAEAPRRRPRGRRQTALSDAQPSSVRSIHPFAAARCCSAKVSKRNAPKGITECKSTNAVSTSTPSLTTPPAL